jgi:hypothetical protein
MDVANSSGGKYTSIYKQTIQRKQQMWYGFIQYLNYLPPNMVYM